MEQDIRRNLYNGQTTFESCFDRNVKRFLVLSFLHISILSLRISNDHSIHVKKVYNTNIDKFELNIIFSPDSKL